MGDSEHLCSVKAPIHLAYALPKDFGVFGRWKPNDNFWGEAVTKPCANQLVALAPLPLKPFVDRKWDSSIEEVVLVFGDKGVSKISSPGRVVI